MLTLRRNSAISESFGGRRNGILDVLLGDEDAVDKHLVDRVPDTVGTAWRTNGSMLAVGLRHAVPFTAVGYVSLEGSPTIALTNLPRSPAGMMRLSLGLEGLAGSADARAKCLDVRQRVLGHEHPDTLISMGNLAETLRAQGDLAGD
jgi:hypothetical protein